MSPVSLFLVLDPTQSPDSPAAPVADMGAHSLLAFLDRETRY